MKRFVYYFALCWTVCAVTRSADAADEIDFNRDIRPLLSDNCYSCHGPSEDSREGGFRLDEKESALGEADSGLRPVVPGNRQASEIFTRISSDDDDLKMPPADANKTLTPAEIDLIGRWIDAQAPWSEHWAFATPRRPRIPKVKNTNWPRGAIDHFILSRIESAGLSPAADSQKTAWLRRVTFDLTGLPPTIAEIDAFLADKATSAHETVVDRLLQSHHYGEHMARFWLDAARYGDTHGLHLDNYREMWPYRDWVVRAYNDNMPYDQFVIEQLAGDLLPEATLDQQVATGFNRCHVTTGEGGSIVEEVYVRNVVDRVVTTGTVFMGMTFECTRCHDHKYDPFTMNDFYSMFAFFNSLDGAAMDGNKKDHAPAARVLSADQQAEIASLRRQIAATRVEIRQQLEKYEYVEPTVPAEATPAAPKEFVWIEDAVPAGANAEGGWQFVDEPVFRGEKASKRTATGLSQHFFTGAAEKPRIAEGDVLFAHVYIDSADPPKEIMMQWNDGSWEHRAYWGSNNIDWGKDGTAGRRHRGDLPAADTWVRLEVPAAEVGLKPGSDINGWAFTQFDGTVYWDTAGIVSRRDQTLNYNSLAAWLRDQRSAKAATLPADIKTLVMMDTADRDQGQQAKVVAYFVENVFAGSREIFDPLHKRVEDAEKKIKQIEGQAASTLVFREKKELRPAYFLKRGEYDQRGDPVPRATPKVLPPMPKGAPLNRLGFAQWLVDRQHPLTARVAVNRFWQQAFGTGLVKTSEDFGSQGEPPSHPQLLDWLAVQFIESGWDVKALMRQIVLSSTYRQTSKLTPELIQRDPENRLLARGPRYRLDAEMLRDQALAVSGLLVDVLGGPSVKPPQPDGLWFAVGYSGSNTVRFKADSGPEKVHRRTLYTFIKRTAPPPQMSTFDGPSREQCTVRRERTNTPLQALLLMNDPQFVEAARALGERSYREGGDSAETRAAYMFRLCTARQPVAAEVSEMVRVFSDMLDHYQADEDAARQLINVGESTPAQRMHATELAAWTMVANLVLNLDEVVTKN